MGIWIGSQESMLNELRDLKKEVTLLRGERDAQKKERNLHNEVLTLRESLETLKIEKARLTEEQERKEREVRHEVGLLRKQIEVEQDLATKEAVITVREENLQADRDRFEEQMKFTTKRFEEEVKYLHDTVKQMFKRLPIVEVEMSKRETVGAVSNGSHADADS